MTVNQILAIVAASGGVVSLIVSLVFAIQSSIRFSIIQKSLSESKKRGTYFICPHCKHEILLKDVDFILPGGSLDNNLNGIPDDQESDAFARIHQK